MSKKLVIVESPHKSKTIEKYLGKDFKVVSSVGHIRDLSTSGKYGFGVDIDNNFKPDYKIIKGKAKLVKELKKDIKDADFVYLATDPDREGEAISWHLYDTLGLKEENYDRIVFNEITKGGQNNEKQRHSYVCFGARSKAMGACDAARHLARNHVPPSAA